MRSLAVLLLTALLLVLFTALASAQEGDITRGSQIYDANCAVCHGAEGQGRVGVNLSQDFPAIDPEAFTRAVIEQGVAGTTMPAWGQQYGGPLDEQAITDVAAFITSLSGGRSPMAPTATPLPVTPVPTVPGATGNPTQGRVLFVQNCAMCHGTEGQGLRGSNLNKTFSSINPQQFVRATVSDGVSGTAMPAWGQAKGGPLSEAEIDDISAYIIALGAQQPSPTATPVPPTAQQDSGLGSVLLALLALIGVAVIIVLIMQFSSRKQP
jgi:mono/diheme cytochrome c family protein